MLIRVTKGVVDIGRLIPPDQLHKVIKDNSKDWYCSPFYYTDTEGVLEHFEKNGKILGYVGPAHTDTLYWDIDVKGSPEKAQPLALQLCYKLVDLGYEDGLEVYFSGSKGFHVLLRTKNQFTPQQTAKICYNVAREANCLSGLDTSVYNLNRIFRIPNTRHQESKLYKIPLEPYELEEKSLEDIKLLAQTTRNLSTVSTPVDAADLVERFGHVEETKASHVKIYQGGVTSVDDVDMSQVPKGVRRCNYRLEQGLFGPGERENACYRIAAYTKSRGLDRDQTKAIVITALERRALRYPDATPWQEKDVDRIVNEVFSESFRGGIFSCKPGLGQDQFLVDHCDMGEGCCAKQKEVQVTTMGIESLIESYVQYGEEALPTYPRFGIKWLDEKIRLRPKNFSVLNGANGSGKTSLVIQLIDNLNKQKLPHIFFSADMADSSLFEKIAAKYTRYTQLEVEDAFSKFTKNPEMAAKIRQDVSDKLKLALPHTIFDFTSKLSPEYIEEVITTVNAATGNKIVIAIVDYAGRIDNDFESDYQKATQNALAGDRIAKKCECHVMYLSQISREHGDHTRAIRHNRVAKSSGAFEEIATVVLNVWRPMGFDPLIDKYLTIFIGKNRGPGVSAEMVFHWEGKSGDIRELTDTEFNEYARLVKELADDEEHKFRRLKVPFREGFEDEDLISEYMSKDSRFEKSNEIEDTKFSNEKEEELPRRERRPRFQRDL